MSDLFVFCFCLFMLSIAFAICCCGACLLQLALNYAWERNADKFTFFDWLTKKDKKQACENETSE